LGISALFSLVPDVRPGEEISTQLQRGDGAWHQSLLVVAPNGFAKTGITGALGNFTKKVLYHAMCWAVF